MYNPEKQGRGPGGKFGAKIVAAVEEVAAEIEPTVTECVEAIGELEAQYVPQAITPLASADPFDYPADEQGKAGLVSIFGLLAIIAILAGLLSHCG